MLLSKVKNFKKLWAVVLFFLVVGTLMPQRSSEASVGLIYFRAVDKIDYIMLEWGTGEEISNLGFNLYRATTSDFDDAEQINQSLIPSQGGELGYDYEWPDNDAEIGVTYTYWIEDIDNMDNGTVHLELPATGTASGGGGIPTVPSPGGNNNTATPTPTQTPTRTPSPTTQSGTNATATRTPTLSPTTQSNTSPSNPTATTAVQSQATTAANSASVPAVQSQNSPTPEPVGEEVIPVAVGETEETPQADSENEFVGDEETTALSIAQNPTNGSPTESESVLAQGIGQNGADAGNEATGSETANTGGSNRSTPIVMALIVSVILLIAGGGGIIALLLNRNKQTRL